MKVDGTLWAIEVKLTTSPNRAHMTRLNRTADLIGADMRFLVTRQPETISGKTQTACDLAGMIATAAQHRP